MLLEAERNYGLGIDALVWVCPWNPPGIMVWAWMLWLPYALRTRTELWFGHGCCGDRMLLEPERNYGDRMLLQREPNYGLGMDVLVSVCSSNQNGIMVWAWMLRLPYALRT